MILNVKEQATKEKLDIYCEFSKEQFKNKFLIIKAIDPTIKILFITVLDILDEILTIVPGITREQIMRKPIDKKIFTNTVNKILN